MLALQYVAMVATIVSMLLIGRVGRSQFWGLWLNLGAAVMWVVCAYAIGSIPLLVQSGLIGAFNVYNLLTRRSQ